MSENVQIEVQIGPDSFVLEFDNDTPYRNIAMEELPILKTQAIGAAKTISEYIKRMPESVFHEAPQAQ